MTLITRQEVLKIARMSHIELKEQEIEPVMKQLEQVLTYAQRVIEVTTTQHPIQTKQENITRSDVPIQQDSQPLLAQAPAREGNFFVVPAIIEITK
jgi:aspartyl-tRNA(Asn)/glutamyl-tRNA(Gln) amidotransferase subunit C